MATQVDLYGEKIKTNPLDTDVYMDNNIKSALSYCFYGRL
ncbi:hypothetical protein QFZ48_004583 [Chitinophaga sp. W2I13]